jgi:hypothetical protein
MSIVRHIKYIMKKIPLGFLCFMAGSLVTYCSFVVWHYYDRAEQADLEKVGRIFRSADRAEKAYFSRNQDVAIWVLSNHLSLLNELYSENEGCSALHLEPEEILLHKFTAAARLCKLNDAAGDIEEANSFELLAKSHLEKMSFGHHSFTNREDLFRLIDTLGK